MMQAKEEHKQRRMKINEDPYVIGIGRLDWLVHCPVLNAWFGYPSNRSGQ